MAPLAIALISTLIAAPVSGADELAGSQGLDTSLPLTDSALTVTGREKFAGLEITVNQTADLTNQAVSITWKGGQQTRSGAGRFSANYLQFMQCWGDDDGSVPNNPGPPPEQCVQGAVAGTYGGIPGTLYPGGFALTRIIARSTWDNFDENVGFLDARTTNVWRPFRAVDGTVVNAHTDPLFNPAVVGGNFWQNPYFDIVTTNEIAGGVTRPNGTGAELFELLTGVQSAGLGCGQRVLLTDGDSQPRVPKCWLVIVPRGEPVDENAGTPFEDGAEQNGVATSPVAPEAWANRIAVPLEFSPVDSPCRLGDDERQVSGNEMLFPAVASWQPSLCGERQLPPFSYAAVGDPTARRQLTSPTVGSPGLVAVSRPVSEAQVAADDPIVYAPLAASGVTIGFNIERVPKPTAPAAAQAISGIRVAELNLTPRLVAKLLTQSYVQSVQIIRKPDYDWLQSNPFSIGSDPDFLQFNPEFALLGNSDRNSSSLTMPAGNSDAAEQLWEWVLSDPEAKAWLDGQPDEWGMQVNPVYSTDGANNTTGFPFGDPIPVSFPKADPYCYQSDPVGQADIVPPPLCGTDWLPYARTFEEASSMTRAAYDRARVVLNPFAFNTSNAWSRSEPQYLGFRTFLSVTDTASAERLGVQTARLSRAGDNRPDRTFVGPTPEGLRAGLESMAPAERDDFNEPSVLDQPAGAYPLTSVTYAAIAPLRLDGDARSDYAEFIRYAVTDGQRPGTALGELPAGYVPLPESYVGDALAAADRVVELEPEAPAVAPPATETTQPPPTTSPSTQPPPATSSPTSPPVRASPGSNSGPSRNTTGGTTVAPPESVAPETTTSEPTTLEEEVPSLEPQPEATEGESVPTREIDMGPVRFAVPAMSSMALASALLALEMTKRPRRRRSDTRPGVVGT